jgi:hypothetical protein
VTTPQMTTMMAFSLAMRSHDQRSSPVSHLGIGIIADMLNNTELVGKDWRVASWRLMKSQEWEEDFAEYVCIVVEVKVCFLSYLFYL